MVDISASYSQDGYSSIPERLEKRLDWETELWEIFLVCPFMRQRPKEMQMVCLSMERISLCEEGVESLQSNKALYSPRLTPPVPSAQSGLED